MPTTQTAEREFKRRFWWAISVPLVLIGLLLGLFIFQTDQLNESLRNASRANATFVQTERLRHTLITMETNAQQYLITHDASTLNDFESGRQLVPGILNDLDQARGNVPDQVIKNVRTHYDRWSSSFRQGGNPLLFRKNWDLLLESIDQVLQVQIASRAQAAVSARRLVRNGTALGIGVAAVLGVLLSLFTRRQLNEIASRYRTAIESTREKAIAVEQALRSRDEFFSIASHELKTPITTLELRAHTLEHLFNELPLQPASRTALQAAMRSMRRQIQKLSELVENILDVSRIRTGQLVLEPSHTDIQVRTLIERSIQESHDILEQFHCQVKLECEDAIARDWDINRIVKAMKELMTNSAKYAPNSTIEIRGSKQEERMHLEVIDHGPGIAPKDHPRIFRLFERAVSSRHYGGLGTGLYITREIIEGHGGKISLKSAPGKTNEGTTTDSVGAIIVIDLPLSLNLNLRQRVA